MGAMKQSLSKRTGDLVGMVVVGLALSLSAQVGMAIPIVMDSETQTDYILAFDSGRDGNMEIYTTNSDGSQQRRVTFNAARDMCPAVSPDGLRIAFQSDRAGDEGIYIINVDGTGEKRLVANGSTPAWSPDGTKIAYTDGDLWIVNADGTQPLRITNTPDVREDCPTFSPNGSRVAFDATNGRHGIATINVDGTDRRQLTPASDEDPYAGRSDSPVWSPDGQTIAYWSEVQEESRITVIRPDGTGRKELTGDIKTVNYQLSFSPDSAKIAFAKLDKVKQANDNDVTYIPNIYVMNVDGTDIQQLTTENLSGSEPSWGPRADTNSHNPQGTPGS